MQIMHVKQRRAIHATSHPYARLQSICIVAVNQIAGQTRDFSFHSLQKFSDSQIGPERPTKRNIPRSVSSYCEVAVDGSFLFCHPTVKGVNHHLPAGLNEPIRMPFNSRVGGTCVGDQHVHGLHDPMILFAHFVFASIHEVPCRFHALFSTSKFPFNPSQSNAL